jgi:hypothetical protein
LVHNDLKHEVKVFASGGWVRDKLLNKKRSNEKLNICFHSDREDITSGSMANLIKEYERYENNDIFSHEKYDEVHHVEASKLKHMDISSFDLKGQKMNLQ